MNNLPEDSTQYNGPAALDQNAGAAPFPFDELRLSPTGRMHVNADRIAGRFPRFREGMTAEDAAIIAGLPLDEARRRVAAYMTGETGHFSRETYAAVYLSPDAGKHYQAPAQASEQASIPMAEIIKFPQPFGEDTRAVSNPLTRCALFAAVNERAYFKDWLTVFDDGNFKIELKGEQLNQDDKDTFAQLYIMAIHKAFGEDVSVSVNAVLAGLGKHSQQDQRKQLFQEIERLVTTSIRLTQKGVGIYVGHLLDSGSTPAEQKEVPRHKRNITYRVNKDLAKFFRTDLYTLYNQKDRLKLGRSSLAKWLHLWIISHASQYPHKVETIREKCGSKTKLLKDFRYQLKTALEVLKTAGIITGWQIDETDLVLIERTPSPAQQEHIARKAANKLAGSRKGKRRNEPTQASDLLGNLIPPKK